MKLKNKRGITLIALVITIIVLLILAGVSLRLVMGDNGLLGKAVSSTEKHEIAQGEEAIKLALSSLFIDQQTGGGKTLEDLDDYDDNITNIEGYVPDSESAIATYKGKYQYEIKKENGSYTVKHIGSATGITFGFGSEIWIGADSAGVKLGKIEGAEGILSVKIIESNGTEYTLTTNSSDEYILPSGLGAGIYTIEATSSSGKKETKEVTIKQDTTAPTNLTVRAEKIENKKIKIISSAQDNQSGIKHYIYSVSPSEGITNPSGTFNGTMTIEVTNEDDYTVTVKAVDKVGNESTSQTAMVTIKEKATVSFDSNGGTGNNITPITVDKGTTVNLPANSFTKTDCIFNGWNTQSDGSGTQYTDGQQNVVITETVTLYAMWGEKVYLYDHGTEYVDVTLSKNGSYGVTMEKRENALYGKGIDNADFYASSPGMNIKDIDMTNINKIYIEFYDTTSSTEDVSFYGTVCDTYEKTYKYPTNCVAFNKKALQIMDHEDFTLEIDVSNITGVKNLSFGGIAVRDYKGWGYDNKYIGNLEYRIVSVYYITKH